MKILIVPDSQFWAIGKLAKAKVVHNPDLNMRYVCVHPRDAGEKETQDGFLKIVEEFNPDIIHFEYYRTAQQLLEALPQLQKRKIILTHHNQRRDKALDYADWKALGVDVLVAHTEKTADILRERHDNVQVIKHGIDLKLFQYNDNEPEQFTVGYSGRIVPWKGLKEIVAVCYELGVELMFMGKPDKADYFDSIPEEHRAYINYSFMDCDDSERPNYYNSITTLVNFSQDDYEEGPLSFFEAMASGTPVITTPMGSAKDLGTHGENCLFVPFADKEALKEAIIQMRDNPQLRSKLRNNGWDTVKNYSEQRMAYRYAKLYHEVYSTDPLVSVIIPTFNRTEQVLNILDSLKKQTYKHLEVIIGDDGSTENLEELVKVWAKDNHQIPLTYVNTGNAVLRKMGDHVYGLGKARNLGVTFAKGEILVFLDSRIQPEADAIMNLKLSLESAKENTPEKKIWVFGDKGSQKKSFIENFSALFKQDFVRFGMFNERIDKYGGISQEVRERWSAQGGDFVYVDTAIAVQIKGSKKDAQRRLDIIEMKDLLYRLAN